MSNKQTTALLLITIHPCIHYLPQSRLPRPSPPPLGRCHGS